jgi:hypothetical protein
MKEAWYQNGYESCVIFDKCASSARLGCVAQTGSRSFEGERRDATDFCEAAGCAGACAGMFAGELDPLMAA